MGGLYILLGFLSGSIMYSYLLPRWFKNLDITAMSFDGNPGTCNAVKYAGIPLGSLCLLCDLGKGFLPVNLFAGYFSNPLLEGLMLASPVLGHAFSPWFKGKGGKGIATTFGVLLALLPECRAVWLLAAIYLFFTLVVVINPNEVRTFWTFALFLAVSLFWYQEMTVGLTVISLTVAYKNIGFLRFPRTECLVAGRKLF